MDAAIGDIVLDGVAGLDQADSLVFNPHKWMFTNFDCSAYYVRDPDQLDGDIREHLDAENAFYDGATRDMEALRQQLFEELVADGETGKLVDPEDIDGLTEAVAAYLDDAERRRLALPRDTLEKADEQASRRLDLLEQEQGR